MQSFVEEQNKTEIKNITFKQLKKIQEFGIVVNGAGGSLDEWINGIEDTLKDKKIVNPVSKTFSVAYLLTDNILGDEGRTDLVLIFSKESSPNIGVLSIWRIEFGGICWIDDFLENYKGDYEQL